MRFIRGLHNLTEHYRHCVATIGNFDGVHRGHQKIIDQLFMSSKQLQLPNIVVIFEPQPQEYFLKEKSPARLTRLREKLLLLRECGVDRVLCLPFNSTIANLSAQDFIDSILIKGLAIRHLIIGNDFRFGHDRQGDIHLLKQASDQHHFGLQQVEPVVYENNRISSTRVRQTLELGDLHATEKMLGRPYSMCGRVVHGQKRGKQWGIPTANIYLHREISPLAGVYAVQMFEINGKAINGVANVGNRPTLGGGKTILEVHLFDFDKDIYGDYVKVNFLHKIRDEKRFNDIDLLKQQILKDIQEAKNYFGK